MRSLFFRNAALSVLVVFSVGLFVLAEESDEPRFAGSDAVPAAQGDAKTAKGDAKPDAKEAPAEALNLNTLAAPLQALFGLGGGVNAVRVEAGPALPADGVAQDDPMMQQFLVQFRPFLLEELNFVRLVCSDLSPQQRPKIKLAGEASLKLAAKQMAEVQNRQNRGAGLVMQARVMPEPRKMIRAAVAKALQETLTDEQKIRFQRDAADRTEQRKSAAILSVVSRLDGCLFLNADQRRKITDQISSNWKDSWEQWLMMSSYGDQYFPVIPDQYVVPHLNADQKSVWQGLQKIDFGAWWGGGNQNQPNDGWWGDESGNAAAPANEGVILNFRAIGF